MTYAIALKRKNIIYSRDNEARTREQNQSRNTVVFFLISAIILFSILYIIQTNNVATKGYNIQQYKMELAELQAKSKNLELRLSEVQSLGFLEERIETLNMIKVSKIDYMSMVSEVAAK